MIRRKVVMAVDFSHRNFCFYTLLTRKNSIGNKKNMVTNTNTTKKSGASNNLCLTSSCVNYFNSKKKRYFTKLRAIKVKSGETNYIPDPHFFRSLTKILGIYNKENMKAYKALNTYPYLALLYSDISEDCPACILRSKVTHS